MPLTIVPLLKVVCKMYLHSSCKYQKYAAKHYHSCNSVTSVKHMMKNMSKMYLSKNGSSRMSENGNSGLLKGTW